MAHGDAQHKAFNGDALLLLQLSCCCWDKLVITKLLGQVSAFGGEEQSDEGDVWTVQWDKGATAWQRDQKV